MKMNAKLTLILMFTAVSAMAQWNWPEDKATAEEKNVLYTDAYKTGNFEGALEPLSWLHQNAPDLNPSIYINGAKIYEGLASKAQDAASKESYQDKALAMYDLRIKYFNQEANVLNRKASTAYKFFRGNQQKYPELLELFDKALNLNGSKFFDGSTVAYMDIIRRHQKNGGNLTDEDILDRYDRISGALANKKGEKYESLQGQIDGMLSEVVTVDCNFVETNLGPKFNAEPSNTKMAKKIIQLSLSGKCTDSDLFMSAAKSVFEAEPDFGMAKVIGLKCKGNGDNTCASQYLNRALDLTEDNTKKGEIYLALGGLEAERGGKSKARDYFRRAVSVDPSLAGKAYTSIGNLYFSSYNSCKAGKSKVDDRGCYLAAYEMFKRAGNTSAMKRAKDQFPSKEEIFLEGKSTGGNLTVGCWIGESVTLLTRD